MEFPRIQIQQGFSQLGLQSTKGSWNIQQPKPTLDMHQEQGKLQVIRSNGAIEIDSRKAWSALGHAKLEEFTDRIAQSSLQVSMENIANIAANGDQMMAIQNKSNAFADISRQNVLKDRLIEFCGPASCDNVDITYTPGELDVEFSPGGITFSPKTFKPVIDYYPGRVDPYLIQKNFIFMTSTGRYLDAVV